MKYGVFFFSRTGNSIRIAQKIANGLGVNSVEIKDNRNWDGLFGYLKAGYYSMANKSVEIEFRQNNEKIDNYIVISPLWAGKPAPAAMEFLKRVRIGKVHLILTCEGSNTDKVFDKLEDKNGKFKSHYGIVKKLKNEEKVINDILKRLID